MTHLSRLQIPTCRITSSALLEYNTYNTDLPHSNVHENSLKNLNGVETNGFMSPATRSKVARMLGVWIDSINNEAVANGLGRYFRNGKVTFVTLTLPSKQRHTDIFIKRNLFNVFIINAIRAGLFRNYFWRAESQKNGNIHFHLIVDSFVDWRALRDLWNESVEPHGYIDEFQRVYYHRDPNSTDVRGLAHVNSVADYVVKYCCKSDGYRKIEGRIWGCSDMLRNLKPFTTVCDSSTYAFIEDVQSHAKSKVFVDPNFSYTSCRALLIIMLRHPLVRKMYVAHYSKAYAYLYKGEPLSDLESADCLLYSDIIVADSEYVSRADGVWQGELFDNQPYKGWHK